MRRVETHIVILISNSPSINSEYSVVPITEDWHHKCNNFKGTLEECKKEAAKMQKADREFYSPRVYTEPHYNNAPYGSIFDY